MTSREPNGSIMGSASSREVEMAVIADTWLDLIDREYLGHFISGGGSAVKFLEGEAGRIEDVQARLADLAGRHGLTSCRVDASATKLHMIQDVFFAISRSLDWAGMAQGFIEALLARQGYAWPPSQGSVSVQDLAAHNGIDE